MKTVLSTLRTLQKYHQLMTSRFQLIEQELPEYSEVLIEEQTRINEQGWEKIPPCLLFLLSKLINEQGGIFFYYMKNCEQGGKKL